MSQRQEKYALDLLRETLKAQGYDGLYQAGGCACDLASLAETCDGVSDECKPGYKTICGGVECDEEETGYPEDDDIAAWHTNWHIGAAKGNQP